MKINTNVVAYAETIQHSILQQSKKFASFVEDYMVSSFIANDRKIMELTNKAYFFYKCLSCIVLTKKIDGTPCILLEFKPMEDYTYYESTFCESKYFSSLSTKEQFKIFKFFVEEIEPIMTKKKDGRH